MMFGFLHDQSNKSHSLLKIYKIEQGRLTTGHNMLKGRLHIVGMMEIIVGYNCAADIFSRDSE